MINLKIYVTEQYLGSYRPPSKGELIYDSRWEESRCYSGKRHQIYLVPSEISQPPHEEEGTWHYNFEATYKFRADYRTQRTHILGTVPGYVKSSLREIGFRGFVYPDGIDFPQNLADIVISEEMAQKEKEKQDAAAPMLRQIKEYKEEIAQKNAHISELKNQKQTPVCVWYPIRNNSQLAAVRRKLGIGDEKYEV